MSEAFATILQHNFDYLTGWEDTARTWEDIEGVHQLRVTLRRMRSALTLFRNAVPKAVSRPWGEEMRHSAGQLGLARDLDVFISEGLDAVTDKLHLSGRSGLLRLAEERRARAYEEEVQTLLDSERYRDFKIGFQAWLEIREWEGATLRKKHAKTLRGSVVPYARRILDKQERRVLAVGSNVDREDTEAMHRLRIECKKLRYAAEFFTPLFAGMDIFISHLKGLQELLGAMNDIAVMKHLLNELAVNETEPAIFGYAGGLIGWRTCDYHHMLARFDEHWEEFVEAKNPWWKKSALVQATP